MTEKEKADGGLMTVPEVADYLGYTEGTIYQKVSRGEIPFVKLGRSVRFRRSEIDEWVDDLDAESKAGANSAA